MRLAAAAFQGVERGAEEEGVLENLLVASSEGLLTCHRLRVNPQPIPSQSPTAHAISPPASPVVRSVLAFPVAGSHIVSVTPTRII